MTEPASEVQLAAWRQEISQRVRQHEADSACRLNPDGHIVEALLDGLVRRKAKSGDFYCPCRIVTGNRETDKNNVCPCVTHEAEIAETGKCHCGLYVGPKK
jgi:ferredoxin-thioredoxin reductase catalytic chain